MMRSKDQLTRDRRCKEAVFTIWRKIRNLDYSSVLDNRVLVYYYNSGTDVKTFTLSLRFQDILRMFAKNQNQLEFSSNCG